LIDQGANPMGDVGPLTQKVLQYQEIMKHLVPTARTPQDWAPLADSRRLTNSNALEPS